MCEKVAVWLPRWVVQRAARYVWDADIASACREALEPAEDEGYVDVAVREAPLGLVFSWRGMHGYDVKYFMEAAARFPEFMGYVYELPDGQREVSWLPRETAYRYIETDPDARALGGGPSTEPEPVGCEYVDLTPVAVRFRKREGDDALQVD